jgi:DTW domain-containing protein YfiP
VSRRVLPEKRCPACEIHPTLCFCSYVKPVETKTRITILMHVREVTLTSNTARLAARMLPAAQVRLFGAHHTPLDVSDLLNDSAYRLAVLFPSERSEEINEEWLSRDPRPVSLIVPDGNWRQASKIPRRIPELANVAHVKLPVEGKSRYRLRHTDRLGGLSTYEAIARAVSLCEQDKSVRTRLEEVFEVMVERRLMGRGLLHPRDVKSLSWEPGKPSTL